MQASINDITEQLKWESQYEYDATGASRIPDYVINTWKIIPIKKNWNSETKKVCYRLNFLANLFYYSVQCLKKTRFQLNPDPEKNLHLQMCTVVMKDGLKEVIEIPRDHFKSSVYSECFPSWRALPFTAADEDYMLRLGATPLFIEWMKKVHQQDIRILLVSEVADNATKLGVKVSNHYVNNEFFRTIFPEILPDTSCTWKNNSLHQKRTKEGSQHGEGTFDFIGVGAALQSRHYDLVVQDDLVGKEALKSEVVMNDTIDYHKLLVGAFDTEGGKDNDELVVGNRWSYKDLNSHIRETEEYFNFITHSALGGCCDLHPYGIPIFPESFSKELLARWNRRLGMYLFSCQFLNFPINPAKQKFNKSNFKYFTFERDFDTNTFKESQVKPGDGNQQKHYRIKIKHKVNEGDVEDDIYPRNLKRYMIIDPNHAMQKGRCRNAISILGLLQKPFRLYLLDPWAEACSADKFVAEIFKKAKAWKMTEIWIEAVGFQKFLKYHLEYYVKQNCNKPGNEFMRTITFKELKSSTGLNAKEERIDSFIPITERKELWLDRNNCDVFLEEALKYGNAGAMIDLLDATSYITQIAPVEYNDDDEIRKYLLARQQRFTRAMTAQMGA